MQEFASKSGVINLVSKLMQQKNIQVKKAILGSLAFWIKAEIFESKRSHLQASKESLGMGNEKM